MKTLAAISLITLSAAAALAAGAASFNGNGVLGFYETKGYGACGVAIDGSKEVFASVPSQNWAATNPNNDPLCKRSVQVTANGKSLKVPIRDKCPSCAANKIDLSKAAFIKIADPSVGTVSKATWSIVD